jgi:Fe-S-cluster containining protein
MELKVLSQNDSPEPWYADGLRFTCSQCGNCCTGGPGFVWISREEIGRLAEFLRITPREVVNRYCRKVNGRISLTETRVPSGNFDCVFLQEEKVTQTRRGADGRDERVTFTRRGCSIYPVRPLQCRTWPFWPENLSSPEAWAHSAKRCHGMNHGRRAFTREQMEALRDAKDWPQDPPTSAAGRRDASRR